MKISLIDRSFILVSVLSRSYIKRGYTIRQHIRIYKYSLKYP